MLYCATGVQIIIFALLTLAKVVDRLRTAADGVLASSLQDNQCRHTDSLPATQVESAVVHRGFCFRRIHRAHIPGNEVIITLVFRVD